MDKYLPIGSVCTLKGKNKKVMITGFYAVEFNGNLKIDDYSGCAFPEGVLLPEFNCTFNHDDIENIDFIGFQNDDQKKLNKLLTNLNFENQEPNETDDNSKNDWVLTSNKSYSKLLFDENGVVVLAEPVLEKKEKKTFKFDENGVVTEENVNNPFYKEYESREDFSFEENNNIFNLENDNLNNNDILEQKKSLSKIKFDENGVVISVDGETLKQEEKYSKYKFDENGILMAINDENNEEEIPPIGPGLPGYVEPQKETKYKFDENGTVVEAN